MQLFVKVLLDKLNEAIKIITKDMKASSVDFMSVS